MWLLLGLAWRAAHDDGLLSHAHYVLLHQCTQLPEMHDRMSYCPQIWYSEVELLMHLVNMTVHLNGQLSYKSFTKVIGNLHTYTHTSD